MTAARPPPRGACSVSRGSTGGTSTGKVLPTLHIFQTPIHRLCGGSHNRSDLPCNQPQTARRGPPAFVRCRTKKRLDDLDYRDGSRQTRPQRRESVVLALGGRVAHGRACTPQSPSESSPRRPAEERLRAARIPFGTGTDGAR